MGRPSKLTPETQKAIVDAIKLGVTYEAAAGAAGIDYHTFNNWMIAGAAAKSGKYLEFFTLVERAKSECVANFVKTITGAAAKGDWKAALEWLKRRDRANWGDALKLDVSSFTDDDIKRLLGIAAASASQGRGAETRDTDTGDIDAAPKSGE